MQTALKTILGDSALAAMGLVPGRHASPEDARPAYLTWRIAWASLAIGIAFSIGLLHDTAGQIVKTWYSSSTFNHGFLILPICVYLIWLKREALARTSPRPFPLAALGTLAAGLVWLAGDVGGVAVVQEIALVLMVQSLFVAILGLRVSRLLLFPLLYLFFAAPFGEALIPPLQDLTALFVVALLRALAIPVFHDGIMISIPTGNFLVAEACSGVRFLIATLALGFLFAHLTYRSWLRKLAFMVCAAAVPIFANGIRAFGLVMIAHVTDGRIAVGIDHVVYGWVFFAIVTVILLALGMTFRERGPGTMPADGPAASEEAAARPRPTAPGRVVFAAALTFLAVGAGPAYALLIQAGAPPAYAGALPTPRPDGGWRLAGLSGDDWVPRFPDAHARLLRTYAKDGREVRLFVAYYSHQRNGAEMIGSRNSIAGDTGWARATAGRSRVRIGGITHDIRRVRMVRTGRSRIAYQWYWIADRITANPYLAKLLQTARVLLGGNEAAAVVIVSSQYDDQPRDADAALQDFVESLPATRSWLPAAAQVR